MITIKPKHVGISVCDMEEALEWYQNVLGFQLKKDEYVPPLKARICFVERAGFELELFEYDEPKPLPKERRTPNSDLQTVGTKHLAFIVDDYEEMKRHLEQHGVDIAHETAMEGNQVIFIRDNSGVLIELIKEN